MAFLNPFSSITDALKLLVVILCIAVGGYGTYRASHFVSDYYTYKNSATTEKAVAKKQAQEAATKVGSDKVTDIAETGIIATDKSISNKHDTQKKDVAKRVADLQNKKPTVAPETPQVGSDTAAGTQLPNASPDAPTVDTATQVSTIYITTLWSNYCEASADTTAQCKVPS